MTVTQLNPELWLETMVRGLHDYALEGFKNAVVDDGGDPKGDEIYDVLMEFPAAANMQKWVPLEKAVIHFEIDDIDTRTWMGDAAIVENYDEDTEQTQPQEGREHRVNFDIGIWSSDRTGGTTARLRAYQILSNLFSGTLAIDKLRQATTKLDMNMAIEGQLDILNFQNGRFLTDSINDIPIYRMIDCSLLVRCFSRTPKVQLVPAIEEIIQDPELIIDQDIHL